jgi:hypothetical protein
MWGGGVENKTGLDGKGFFVAIVDHFAAYTVIDWVLFSLKLGAFVFIFFMIPTVLNKLGFKGWVPPTDEERE